MPAQILYAPIRKKYHETRETNRNNVDGNYKTGNNKCPFCNYKEKQEQVVYDGNTAVIISNNFPYNFGHLLIIPKRHVVNIEDLNKDEDKDVMLLIKRGVKYLKTAFNPEGFNIGVNIGDAGGTIDHLHFHIVPRYKGDIGFMNVLNNITVQANKPEEMVAQLKQKNGLR